MQRCSKYYLAYPQRIKSILRNLNLYYLQRAANVTNPALLANMEQGNLAIHATNVEKYGVIITPMRFATLMEYADH